MLAATKQLDTKAFAEFVSGVGDSVAGFWPEIVLGITLCAVLLYDLVLSRERSKNTAYMAFGGTLLSLALVFMLPSEPRSLFSGMLALDSFSTFFKAVILIGTLVTVALTQLDKENIGARLGEYYGILLAAVLGMMLMASSTNMIMIYLAVELASLSSYVIVAHRRQSRIGSEASLKYAIYGSVASALMLYGISLLFGMTGSLSVMGLADLGIRMATDVGFGIAVGLVLAGLAYKMAAFPMHFWVPDVYQGAPTAVTAFLSVASKTAAFAILLRFMASLDPGSATGIKMADGGLFLDWTSILAVAAAVTMTLGNLAALFQTNIKRMLGYSSIAHAGYILMGVAALEVSDYAGFKAVAFYLLVYLFTNLGAFAVVIVVSNQVKSEEIEAYKGLGTRMWLPALLLTIFLFSLIGMPPTAGFTGKFLLFRAAIDKGLYWLAIMGGINTAVSVYYYMRILKFMYLEDSAEKTPYPAPCLLGKVLTVGLALPVLLLFFLGAAAGWTKNLSLLG